MGDASRACLERRFVNEVGSDILISVGLGVDRTRYCRVCVYGPHSSIESYLTFMELRELRDALNDLPIDQLPQGSAASEGQSDPTHEGQAGRAALTDPTHGETG